MTPNVSIYMNTNRWRICLFDFTVLNFIFLSIILFLLNISLISNYIWIFFRLDPPPPPMFGPGFSDDLILDCDSADDPSFGKWVYKTIYVKIYLKFLPMEIFKEFLKVHVISAFLIHIFACCWSCRPRYEITFVADNRPKILIQVITV